MKNRFTRNKTAAAITVALAALAVSVPSLAVNHSDTGLGEVGLVPYYTVRAGYDTFIDVVNTSDTYVVAFKIRFHEANNSRDVRDFNVFLSPNDVWTARVTMGADGKTPQIRVPTADKTCTSPWNGTDPNASFVVQGDEKYLNFTNIAYAGGSFYPPDGGPQGIARAQEGYIEIVEMGVAVPKSKKYPNASVLAAKALHGAKKDVNGTVMDCAFLGGVYTGAKTIKVTASKAVVEPSTTAIACNTDVVPAAPIGSTQTSGRAFQAEFCEPLNVLKVAATIVRADVSIAASVPVTTLANFYNPPIASAGVENVALPNAQDIMQDPSQAVPNLTNALPPRSIQINNGQTVVAEFDADSPDTVSSLFSSTDVVNEYVTGGVAPAGNAWVVTFPTKGFYVDPFYSNNPEPFENLFDPPLRGESCTTVNYSYYNREEATPTTPPGGVVPSPPPIVPIPANSICQEAQTLNFAPKGTPNLLDSQSNYVVPTNYAAGWMRLGFPKAGTINSLNGWAFQGLPALGFSMAVLPNGALNFSTTMPHAFYRDIQDIK